MRIDADPMYQFKLERLVPLDLAGFDISFTNAALWMAVAVALRVPFTGFTVSTIDGHYVLIPIQIVSTLPPRKLDITGRLYARLCSSTGQPSLI